MTTRIQVVFYSMYGHIWQLAQAIAEGADTVDGAQVQLLRVPELIPEPKLAQSGAKEAQQAFAHIPVADPEELAEADGVVVGTPTRFGGLCAQMRNFWDQTGSLWQKGALIGKAGGAFTSTATQHGGQETTLRAVHTTLLHHGLTIVGIPYSAEGLSELDEISGGSPYGATTVTGPGGDRQPSANERRLAVIQGERVARVARALQQAREAA